MKQIVPLIILILYSILQARRKAMREQKMQQQAIVAQRTSSAPPDDVTPDVNSQLVERQSVAMEASDRWKNMTEEADRFVDTPEPEFPKEVRTLLAAARLARQKPAEATVIDDEVVDRLVVATPASGQEAYTQVALARRRISFDKEAMRTFFVTREALGPPRSRKPFRPGIKARE